MYHVKDYPYPVPGNLDLQIADDEEFSPDKLRSNVERLYMTVVRVCLVCMHYHLLTHAGRLLVSWSLQSSSSVSGLGGRRAVQHAFAQYVSIFLGFRKGTRLRHSLGLLPGVAARLSNTRICNVAIDSYSLSAFTRSMFSTGAHCACRLQFGWYTKA